MAMLYTSCCVPIPIYPQPRVVYLTLTPFPFRDTNQGPAARRLPCAHVSDVGRSLEGHVPCCRGSLRCRPSLCAPRPCRQGERAPTSSLGRYPPRHRGQHAPCPSALLPGWHGRLPPPKFLCAAVKDQGHLVSLCVASHEVPHRLPGLRGRL
jgi:hypothetical protein